MQYYLKRYMKYFAEFLEETLDKRFRRKVVSPDPMK
jgi:hypothetical protein